MVLAVVIALSSIAFGTLLGLLPGSSSRAASPFRTFAMVTAVAVVLGQLLPEALGAVGIAALGAFALGFVAPRVAERCATYFSRPACSHDDAMCTDLGLELGYIGLLLHHVGDGIGLGLYAGPLHDRHNHYDVLVALAAHTIPVTALVALAFRTHRGPMHAVLRAVGIAATTVVGVGLANLLTPEQLATWEPWLTAFVGGLLLHIVAHGWHEEQAPTPSSRLMDFAAIAAGIAIMVVGGQHSHSAEHGLPDLRHAMADALVDLSLETAPMLLLGLAVAAVLQTQGSRIPERFLRGGGSLTQSLRGALLGLPLPVCACGVLPVAHSLRQRGGSAALVVAFLLATPELGVDAFALTVRFFGWEFAYLRLAGALLVAVVTALVVARFAAPQAVQHDHGHAHDHPHDQGADDKPFARPPSTGALGQVLGNFDELLYHVGAWTLVGLIAAAYLQATLTHGALGSIAGSGLDILFVSLIAVPSYVCASSATPLAAVLVAKGVSPGAVLSGLLLGPATNIATLAWLRKAFGKRATIWGSIGLLAATWSLALATNQLMDLSAVQAPSAAEHSHGAFSYACAGLLLVLLVRAVWRNGLRTWLGSLGETLTFDAPHAHGHAPHAHAHGPVTGGAHHDHAHE